MYLVIVGLLDVRLFTRPLQIDLITASKTTECAKCEGIFSLSKTKTLSQLQSPITLAS